MTSARFKQFAVMVASLIVAVSALVAPMTAQAQDKSALFINLTNDDPWKVAMAAFFATNFALKQDHKPVVIFVSVQATSMFHKNKASVRAEQFGKTVHEMYREFQAAGGKVLVCPVCMKALSMTDTDLIEGAEVASVKTVNEVLFRADTKVLAW
jgi:predicted peroxiredoxin